MAPEPHNVAPDWYLEIEKAAVLRVSVLELPDIPMDWHMWATAYLAAQSEAAEVMKHPEKYGRRA
jgi:hypothetical protein